MLWTSSSNFYRALIAIVFTVMLGLLNGQTNPLGVLSNSQPEPSSILGKIQSSLNQKFLQDSDRHAVKLTNSTFGFLAIALKIIELVACGIAIYFVVRLQFEEGLPFNIFWRRNDGGYNKNSESVDKSSSDRDKS